MRLIIGFIFIVYFLNAFGQPSQMPPTIIQHTQLPLNLEGYTVNINASGQISLYGSHSNEQARNIYNHGGIRFEIKTFERVANIQPGQTIQEQISEVGAHARLSKQGLLKGELYKFSLRILLGDDFDNRQRRPTNIQAPVSQVIVHWPDHVNLVSNPVIKIDGVTQAQQMVSNLLNIASIGLTPGPVHMALSLKSFIIKAIDKAVTENLVSGAFSTYRSSEILEIYEGINFGGRSNLQQLTWVLGGHKRRDISTAKSAEITFYLQFEEAEDFDLSIFFNIWGTHSYTPSSPITMGLKDIILFSFRQHVVINTRVVEEENHLSKQNTFTDPRDGQTYKWVKIGNQVWMAENLNFTSVNSWCYNNLASNCETYGRLYDWEAALKACPPGWRLPILNEWKNLIDLFGGWQDAPHALIATSWNNPIYAKATNSSGFTALPGGMVNIDGAFRALNYMGLFWAIYDSSSIDAAMVRLEPWTYIDKYRTSYGLSFSVRCIGLAPY